MALLPDSTTDELTVSFVETNAAEANHHATSLVAALLQVDQSVLVEQRRESNESQDLGTALQSFWGGCRNRDCARHC